jgi:hypothetical protein
MFMPRGSLQLAVYRVMVAHESGDPLAAQMLLLRRTMPRKRDWQASRRRSIVARTGIRLRGMCPRIGLLQRPRAAKRQKLMAQQQTVEADVGAGTLGFVPSNFVRNSKLGKALCTSDADARGAALKAAALELRPERGQGRIYALRQHR